MRLLITYHRFPTRGEVDAANSLKLEQIDEKPITFKAFDVPGWDKHGTRISEDRMKKILGYLVAQKELTLKVSPVMSSFVQRKDLTMDMNQ